MALLLNGSTQYVATGITNVPNVNVSQSISCWFMHTVAPTGNMNIIAIMNDGVNAGNQLGFRNQGTGEHILMWQYGGGTTVEGTFLPANDVWHHAVWTWDGTTNRLYVNGVEDANSLTALQTAAITDINFGRWTGGSEYYPGTLDDMRIYDRALSPEEVATIYAARGTDGIVDGLVSRWLMNEGSEGSAASGAGNVRDSAINANNGEAFTSPTYEAGGLRFRRKTA